MGFNVFYPLVNGYIAMENHHAMKMGKLTISMVIFNSKLLNYQRVLADLTTKKYGKP